jgi:hypothetical protein
MREDSRKRLRNSWWAEQGSNLRPRPCKGRALPAELSARVVIVVDLSIFVNLSVDLCARNGGARPHCYGKVKEPTGRRSG